MYPNYIWLLNQRSQGFHLYLIAEHFHTAALQNESVFVLRRKESSVQEAMVSPCLIVFTIKYEPSKSALAFIFRLKKKENKVLVCVMILFSLYFRVSD